MCLTSDWHVSLHVGSYSRNHHVDYLGWSRWSVWKTSDFTQHHNVKTSIINFRGKIGHLLFGSDSVSSPSQDKEAKSASSNCCWFTGVCMVLPGPLHVLNTPQDLSVMSWWPSSIRFTPSWKKKDLSCCLCFLQKWIHFYFVSHIRA